jgi:hypothetical protein
MINFASLSHQDAIRYVGPVFETPYFQTLLKVMEEKSEGIEYFKKLDLVSFLTKFNDTYRNSFGTETASSIVSQIKKSLSRKIYLTPL